MTTVGGPPRPPWPPSSNAAAGDDPALEPSDHAGSSRARKSEDASSLWLSSVKAQLGGADGFDGEASTGKRTDAKAAKKKNATISSKRTGYVASAMFFGAEIAVKVNHVDPLNEGRKDVKFNWVADGSHGLVDVESALWRGRLGKRGRFEIQGPAIQAKAEGEQLPLKVRFTGIGLATDITTDAPGDDTPPRVELKVEVKLTDKSVASLAALAGATEELTGVIADLSASGAGEVIGNVLLTAVPLVTAGVAAFSVRRAVRVVRDPEASTTEKAFAVARAAADATAVVFPVVGTVANIALVVGAVALAKLRGRRRGDEDPPPTERPGARPPATGPPSVGDSSE